MEQLQYLQTLLQFLNNTLKPVTAPSNFLPQSINHCMMM